MKRVTRILSLLLIMMMVATMCFATNTAQNVASQEEKEDVVEVEDADDDLTSTEDELSEAIDSLDYTYRDYLNSMLGEGNYSFGDVYLMEENVLHEKMSIGNVYLMGNNVEVTSYIAGNLFVMGNNVTLNPQNVEGSIYVLANDLTVTAQAYDLYAIANNITIEEESAIIRDIKLCGENVVFNGTTYGSIYAAAEDLTIGDNTYIEGDIYYSNNVSVPSSFESKLVKLENNFDVGSDIATGVTSALKTYNIIANIVTALVIVVIAMLVMPKSDHYESDINNHFIKDVLCGVCGLIVILLLAGLLLITIVGIPAGLIILLIWILLVLLATPIATIEFSKFILGNRSNSKVKVAILAVGLYVAVSLIEFVPVVGIIVSLVCIFYGFGFALRKLFSKKKCNNHVETNKEEMQEIVSEEDKEVIVEPIAEEKKEEVVEETIEEAPITTEEEEVITENNDTAEEPIISDDEKNDEKNDEEE